MPIKIPQVSFGGGEVSPQTYSRLDLQKFGSSAKRLRNFFVRAEGGISNKPGTKFVKRVKDKDEIQRLIKFEFNEVQSYALEFGNLYMRVHVNGGTVTETQQNITGATQANPVVITSASHGYVNGDEVFISGVGGMTEINNKYFTVANVAANTFELSGIDGTSYTAYTSGGTVERVFELVTPWADTDLADLKFRQSNDIIYFAHPDYPKQKLSRLAVANWTIEEVQDRPSIDFPTNITVTVNGTTGSETAKYRVTAVSEETAEESLIGTGDEAAITGATQTDPVVITATAHGYSDGDQVYISGVGGMTEINDLQFTITNVNVNDFELKGIDGTSYTAYTSGGSADRTHGQVTNGNATSNNTITWDEVSGAESYNVYKEDNGLWGFVGSTETTSFTEDNIAPDLEDTAPKWRQPFSAPGEYPGAVGLHEQRSVWGGSTDGPLEAYLSQTSQFENFNVSSPTKASDAVTLRLVTGKGNEIRHFRSFREYLFCFTSGAVWTIGAGGDADAITPSSKQVKVQEYLASTQVPPLTIKTALLMVAGKADLGFEVHSIGEDINSGVAGNYVGSDLTVLARHLFEGYTIKEWCYIERPHRLILAIRNDGKLLCMTYLNEHQVFAWSLWETEGTYESLCHVPEGQRDTAYFVVKRTINGVEEKYIEQLADRIYDTIEDAFFVDSGLTLDNPVTISGATQANPVVITATAHGFSNGDKVKIRDVVGMTELNKFSFTVANATANTFELSGTDGTSYTAYESGGTAREEVTTISGLDHLEGRTDVIALTDGNLVKELTVSNGSVTIPDDASIIHVGLPYDALFESLPINMGAETLGNRKNIKAVIMRMLETRGIFAGTTEDKLEEYDTRSDENWGDPASTISDIIRINVTSDWKRDNGVIVKSDVGLPMTMLSVIGDTNVGGG